MLDCIVIGYNDEPFSDLLSRLEPYKSISAAYEHNIAQSVVLRGKRLKYSELITECIAHSSGRPCDLNIFRMPSLGIHYLVNFLRKKGIKVEPINFFNYDKGRLKELLLKQTPFSVAISTTYYYEAEPARRIVEFIRKYNNDVAIIMGGTYINNVCFETDIQQQEWTFEKIGADIYVNDLQGELTLSKVCKELRNKKPDLQSIPNLIYWNGKGFKRTERKIEKNNLDYNIIEQISFENDTRIPAVFCHTSRSCPNKCSFCRYPLFGGEYTLAHLDSVEKELDYYKSCGVEYVVFVDDTFNIPLNRFKKLCRLMIRKQYNFKWFSYFRCSDADEEAFDLMKEAGCNGVFLGIESGDPTILKIMNKKATVEEYKHGIQELNKRDILTLASCMVGFPGETEVTAKNTLNFIEETKPTFYSLQVYFHETKVPINDRNEEFGMKGYGYAWSHKTMDWRQASKIVYEGYKKIKGSIILPFYSFNIWSFAYYMSQGFTRDQLLDFTRAASEMLGKGLEPLGPEYSFYEERLLNTFK